MHREILSKEQAKLLPLVQKFSKDFGLVGGTAIALQIGHRQSIDFDLFSLQAFSNAKIRNKIVRNNFKIVRVLQDEKGEYTIAINNVIFTFLHYPFKIKFSKNFADFIKMPDLLTLAAMKAYALGRRAKWKDYVDIYFILKNYYSVDEIARQAKKIFSNEFNEKIFRAQLSYFININYSEKLIYLDGFAVSDSKIKKALEKFSIA